MTPSSGAGDSATGKWWNRWSLSALRGRGENAVNWGNHTPAMDIAELGEYLDRDLSNELSWLLRAATEWYSQDCMKLAIPGYETQVFTMDSTFLHARTLFEFFTRPTQEFFYGYDAFGLSAKIPSNLYEKHWAKPLHGRLMHAQDRAKSPLVKRFASPQPKADIKDMPVDFAKEIVRMWHGFARELEALGDPRRQQLGQRAHRILIGAKEAAEAVRSNAVTECHIAQRKKDAKLDPAS